MSQPKYLTFCDDSGATPFAYLTVLLAGVCFGDTYKLNS